MRDTSTVASALRGKSSVPINHDSGEGQAVTANRLGTTISRRKGFAELRSFARPVRIVFGAADPYLNAGVAKRFHRLSPTSDLFLLPNARHYVQIDAPAEVAQLILSAPTSQSPYGPGGERLPTNAAA